MLRLGQGRISRHAQLWFDRQQQLAVGRCSRLLSSWSLLSVPATTRLPRRPIRSVSVLATLNTSPQRSVVRQSPIMGVITQRQGYKWFSTSRWSETSSSRNNQPNQDPNKNEGTVRAGPGTNPNIRIHGVLSTEELSRETDILIKRIQRKDKRLCVEFCYEIMELWFNEAKSGSSRDSRSHNLPAAYRAHEILKALDKNRSWGVEERRALPNTLLIPPRSSFYDVVLQAYGVCGGGVTAAKESQQLLQDMLDQCRRYREEQCQYQKNNNGKPEQYFHYLNRRIPPEPTVKTFNICMNAWAKSGEEDAGPRAESIVSMMVVWKRECEFYKNSFSYYKGCLPNIATHGCTIDAWSRRSNPQSQQRVLELLHLVKSIHEENQRLAQQHKQQGGDPSSGAEGNLNENLGVDVQVFNAALKVFVDPKLGRNGALKAEEVLRFYQKWHEIDWLVQPPNVRTYTLLMEAWSQCGTEEGASRAQEILNTMIELYKQGNGNVFPNLITFSSCIMAWSRLAGHVPHAPERAEEVLVRLVDLYEETGDESLRPSSESCNSVISAWCRALRRPDSMERARRVFDKVKRYATPDLITYNAILNGLSKRGLGAEALDLLNWLESPTTLLEPDLMTYNTVITAISRDRTQGRIETARAILERMKNHPSRKRSDSAVIVRPDVGSFTCMMMCWAYSGPITIQNARQAHALVQEMQDFAKNEGGDTTIRYSKYDHGLEPDAFFLTSLIRVYTNVFGSPEEKQEALQEVLQVFDQVVEKVGGHEHLSHVNYDPMFTAIYHLSEECPRERIQLLQSLFATCAEHGFVSSKVASFMVNSNAMSPAEFGKSMMPPSWCRNVTPQFRPRSQQPQQQWNQQKQQ